MKRNQDFLRGEINMLKVLVTGANGRMGQEVINTILQDEEMLVLCGFDKESTGEYAFPVYTKIEEIEEKPDVIIDFSVPAATFTILKYAQKEKVPIVIATTGFSEEELEKIEEIAKEIPVFQSFNMSFDVNLMLKVVADIAIQLKGTDIEIIETHHNRKIDSPSGTAIMLADSINNALGNTHHYEFNRHDKHEKRDKNEIGFSSIRGGNIVGEHTVQFFGENEVFEISHKSYSRTVFAEGAVKAAKFIVSASPQGMYHMKDLLN